MGLDRVELYYAVMEQMVYMFKIRLVFATELISTIEKNKSWCKKESTSINVANLVIPLAAYIRLK